MFLYSTENTIGYFDKKKTREIQIRDGSPKSPP